MAKLIINPDIDCNIYIDTEYYGEAKANTDFVININVGSYWVDCRCKEDDDITYNCDINITEESDNISVRAHILNYTLLVNLKENYDNVSILCKNILLVKKSNRYGIINKSGKELISVKYESIKLIGDTLLKLELNGRFGLANLEGIKITPLKYLRIENAMNGIYALFFDCWQFVDSNAVKVDVPDNVLLYTTINDSVIKIERTYSSWHVTYDTAFQHKPMYEECVNGHCILIFKESVTVIGEKTFQYCNELKSIQIPEKVSSIGKNAFSGCKNLSEFKGKFASNDGKCIIIDNSLKAFAIGCGAVYYTLPSDLTSIDYGAFYNCNSIIDVTIPDSVTEIGACAFHDCSNLTNINIPDSVTAIGYMAFEGCQKLANINIGNLITSIEKDAFCFCESLNNVTIPNNIQTIGNGAFYDCKSLTEIIIPDNVTSIGNDAFYGCSNLTSIHIGECVKSIGKRAFRACHELKEFYCKSIIPPKISCGNSAYFSGIFSDHISQFRIYVPSESVSYYKTQFGWSNYANYIEGYPFISKR